MKIQPDQINALTQEAAEKSKGTFDDATNPFGDILAKEVGVAASRAAPSSVPPLSGGLVGVSGLFGAGEVEPVGNLSEKERAVMENMDGLLNQWENYAERLASGDEGAGLKQAYGVLENIESGVKKIKEDLPGLGSKSADLESLVNELEVMAVTEKIKFNRGDYI